MGAPSPDTGPAAVAPQRLRVHVDGTVQGVGFRPHVYRLATALGLGGFVRNDGAGVLLEVEGDGAALQALLTRLATEAPAAAAIERVRAERVTPRGERRFAILDSAAASTPAARVMTDTAICADCLAELFDPADPRFRYPFINCTACGPRFTIVRAVPYDRPRTTMRRFTMCARCQAEYDDPAHRRFHAQPTACPACGPSVRLADGRGRTLPAADPIAAAAAALRAGRIVAVKGIGGFHFACRADDPTAVAALRERKRRDAKPFAVMAPTLDAARALVEIGAEEAALLADPAGPIVLARWQRDAPVAAAVAPGLRDGGVLLPYSPLHHLLLADAALPLVMTSGNRADEPIAYRDADALRRLRGIADLFLLHTRPIHVRSDDSVARIVTAGGGRRPMLLRRSRGYVPAALALPAAERPILACGADLKNAFCLAKDGQAWVGQHIGDLGSYPTLRAYGAAIAHFERLFAVAPEIVAHDLHPDYASSGYARGRAGVTHIAVQHHHAHFAACLAEHEESGPAIGVVFDGTGYGTDGTIWGGELLVGDVAHCARAGHLWPVRLPGGDRAVREPWRMACAWVTAALGDDPPLPDTLAPEVPPRRWAAVAALARSGVAAPWTSSAGRLFDAVSALCGLRAHARYEGEAAIALEACADETERGRYPLPLLDGEASDGAPPPLLLDARETLRAVLRDLGNRTPAPVVSARFHNALAHAVAAACTALARRHGVGAVVFSGGVFQNRLLLERAAALAGGAGLRVLVPRRLPPNDGGIAFGQAAIAAARCRASRPGEHGHGHR